MAVLHFHAHILNHNLMFEFPVFLQTAVASIYWYMYIYFIAIRNVCAYYIVLYMSVIVLARKTINNKKKAIFFQESMKAIISRAFMYAYNM